MSLEALLARIGPVDEEAGRAAQAALDAKTKPRGSLGRLEALAVRIATIVGEENPGRLEAAVVVAAGDHGVAVEGVSAYPPEVTRGQDGPASVDQTGAVRRIAARRTEVARRTTEDPRGLTGRQTRVRRLHQRHDAGGENGAGRRAGHGPSLTPPRGQVERRGGRARPGTDESSGVAVSGSGAAAGCW